MKKILTVSLAVLVLLPVAITGCDTELDQEAYTQGYNEGYDKGYEIGFAAGTAETEEKVMVDDETTEVDESITESPETDITTDSGDDGVSVSNNTTSIYKTTETDETTETTEMVTEQDLGIEIIKGSYILVEAQPEYGFYWDYYLYVSSGIVSSEGTYMLVEPNNTGTSDDDMAIHYQRAKGLVSTGYANTIASGLKTALLVPVISRPRTIPDGWNTTAYTHALTRDTLLITQEEYKRLDLQLIKMIEHAREVLHQNGIEVAEKVFMHGFSASGQFANRFPMIHPNMVQAVAAGGLNGMPTLPVESWSDRDSLRYPVGIADLVELTGMQFDIEEFKKVPQYWYMGFLDSNDTLPYTECYATSDAATLRHILGDVILDRWEKSQEIFESAGIPAQFVTYGGTGHQIKSEMISDIIEFFKSNTGDEIVHITPHEYDNELHEEVTVIRAYNPEESGYPEGMKQYYNWENTYAVYIAEWIISQDYNQLSIFIRENVPVEGRVIYLVAPDGTRIPSYATGGTFSSNPQGFIFEIQSEDRDKVQPGITYTLESVKESDTYFITISDSATLTGW